MEWSYHIPDGQVRYAFRYLVEIACSLQDFYCQIVENDAETSFCLTENSTGQTPFGFSANSDWLLFTFREAAIRSTSFSLQELQSVFSSAHESNIGEWSVRMRTQEDVDSLLRFIGWHIGNPKMVRDS